MLRKKSRTTVVKSSQLNNIEEDYQSFPTTDGAESYHTPAYAKAYATFSRPNDSTSSSYNYFDSSDPQDFWVHTMYDGDNEDNHSEKKTEDIPRFASDFPIEHFDQLNPNELQICRELRIRTIYDFAHMGRKLKKKFIRKLKQQAPNQKNAVRAHQLFNTARSFLIEFEMSAKYAREQEMAGGTVWGGADYSTTIGFFEKFTDSAGFTKSSAVRKGQVTPVGTGGGVMDRENDNRNLSYLDHVVPKIIRQKKCFSISEFAQVFKQHTGRSWNMYWNGSNLVELLQRYERNGDCEITCRGASDFVITSKDFNSPKKSVSNARWNSRPDATARYSKMGGRTPPQSLDKRRKKKQKIVMSTPPSSDYSD